MRVLFLCHRYLDTQIGGLAEFLHHLPKELKNIGIDSIIYTQNEDGSNKLSGPITLANGISCYTGPFIKPSLFCSNRKLKPLLELCRSQKIDLIHAQGVYRSGYMAMKMFQKTHIPYVLTSHSDILSTASERMKRGKTKRRCAKILKNAQSVTHLTPIMAKATHEIFDTKNKSAIIGNGINLKLWEPFTQASEKNYVLAIGRLERGKGFHILIDAMAQLKNQNIDTSFVIAGKGAEEKNLQQQALNLGFNVLTEFNGDEIPKKSVVFTGYIKGDAKMQLMANAKIILFATQPELWEEAFPIVQLEIMAAGKATISSDIETTHYLQQLGLQTKTVIANNPAHWANEIISLLRNDQERSDMAKINLMRSQRFDWREIANQYMKVYLMK